MKKFLLLAGKPIGSMDILEYAKRQGYYTIVCDYLPKDKSLAKQYADESWDISTDNIAEIVSRAKENNIDAIFTGVHEFNIQQCEKICRLLKLPFYATEENLKVTSNKSIYKQIWKDNGINIIPNQVINFSNIQNIKYPILLKPVDGSGAYGLNICNSETDLQSKYEQTLDNSKVKQCIAEQYIQDKEEITVVYIIKNGLAYLASVADRIVKDISTGYIPLPTGYIWPSKYLSLYENQINTKMKAALTDMKLQNGMVFIQCIVKDNSIYPYDMGFRISGTQEHIVLQDICGYNPLELLTDFALGKGFGTNELISKINPHFKTWASNITFLAYPAKINRFIGIDKIQTIDGVIRVVKNKQEGEIIPQSALGTLNQIVLRVFARAESKEKLLDLIKLIRQNIVVYDDAGTNILVRSF